MALMLLRVPAMSADCTCIVVRPEIIVHLRHERGRRCDGPEVRNAQRGPGAMPGPSTLLGTALPRLGDLGGPTLGQQHDQGIRGPCPIGGR